MGFVNLSDYSSAVRGYHYYRNNWQPQPEKKLVCSPKNNNPYDFFPIKVAVAKSGMVVGCLPMENSRVTKYILNRGARVYAILTSTNYCVSLLVRAGLEIPCNTITLNNTLHYNNNIITLSITNKRRPALRDLLLIGAAELRKIMKSVVKKHRRKDEEVMLLHRKTWHNI